MAGRTHVSFSRLLELELAEVIFRVGLQRRHANWRRARLDGRARRRAGNFLTTTLEAWRDVLRRLDWAVVELERVIDKVPALMARHGLSSYDAAHAATALLLGVEDLVTLDPEFSYLPGLRLHVPSARVRRCRQIRSGLRLE